MVSLKILCVTSNHNVFVAVCINSARYAYSYVQRTSFAKAYRLVYKQKPFSLLNHNPLANPAKRGANRHKETQKEIPPQVRLFQCEL
jgi:ssDNA-specific exonuclease RecJ